jgi:hypothetical protein
VGSVCGGCITLDLFGEPQTILHMANKRDTAMEVLRPAGLWALEKYGKGTVRWGNTAAGHQPAERRPLADPCCERLGGRRLLVFDGVRR